MATNPAMTPPPASSVIFGRPEETPSGFATTMTHFVTVGKKADRFDPEIVVANAGDKIHKNGAIWSDWAFVPTIKLEDEMPSFTWTVRTADQLFVYCGAPGSCNRAGMVMMINPNGSVAFELYRQAALAAPYALTPGEPFPSDEDHSSVSEGVDPAATTATPSPPTTHTISAVPVPESKNLTAIAGIVIGGVGALALVALLSFLFLRHRRCRRSVPHLGPHQRDFQYFPPVDALGSPSSAGNPYFQGDKSANLQYTSELAPTSPMLQPRGLSIHNSNMREPATRETVIISVTEEEKATYLERLHALQTGINGSGGASPTSTTGAGVGQSTVQRPAGSQNIFGIPSVVRTQSINQQNVQGAQSHPMQHEYGAMHAQQSPEIHEMAASKFDEEKGGIDEELTVIDPGEGNGGERYGQVYPQ
ncbi:hypothetical protein TWF696_004277 [Orbilia brochopaga]|uniref:Extracellular serine-rich protein n=1 Tax=Orbilia brochopaga TaxID=3140254 RepID=A0AAV9V894_9PEZI